MILFPFFLTTQYLKKRFWEKQADILLEDFDRLF